MSTPAENPAKATASRLILHLSGKETPGVVTRLCRLIQSEAALLLHLTKSSLEGCVVIGAVIECADPDQIRSRLAQLAVDLSLHIDTSPAPDGTAAGGHSGVCVSLLGDLSGGRALGDVTEELLRHQLTLDDVRSLSRTPRAPTSSDATEEGSSFSLRGVELIASRLSRIDAPELKKIRGALLSMGPELGVDLAVQRDDFYRRSKRLLCMDVDSTFVKGEFIDELAELVGVKSEVAQITERAMRGELDFAEALRERVKLLAGLPMSRARELCDKFELTPGATDLVRTVKQLGMRVGLVSGGFDFFVEMLKDRFGLDFAFANELEVENGKLTGNVVGTIVDAHRKAQVLKDMSHVFGIRLEQTIAVGDGANDVHMLQAAGLGIAYHAKPRLQEVADTRFNHHDRLDTLLYLMGYDAHEVVGACR